MRVLAAPSDLTRALREIVLVIVNLVEYSGVEAGEERESSLWLLPAVI